MKKVKQCRTEKLICKRLNFVYSKSGWTKTRWSQESNVPEGRIKEYLFGERNPTTPTLEKLLDALPISFTRFYRTNKFDRIPGRKKTVQK